MDLFQDKGGYGLCGEQFERNNVCDLFRTAGKVVCLVYSDFGFSIDLISSYCKEKLCLVMKRGGFMET